MRTLPVLLLSITLSGCAMESLTPRNTLEGLPPGLEVSLTVEPDRVERHAPFVAGFSATNTTADTIRIVTAGGCLVRPGVFRSGARVPVQGSNLVCYGAITTHTFAPGAGREMSWPMRAELYAEHPGDIEGAPAPAGSYRVRAEFDLLAGNRPAVEATLLVR
jgi:hypothetical protein